MKAINSVLPKDKIKHLICAVSSHALLIRKHQVSLSHIIFQDKNSCFFKLKKIRKSEGKKKKNKSWWEGDKKENMAEHDITQLWKLQQDVHEFKASLGYLVRLWLKTKSTRRNNKVTERGIYHQQCWRKYARYQFNRITGLPVAERIEAGHRQCTPKCIEWSVIVCWLPKWHHLPPDLDGETLLLQAPQILVTRQKSN